ncbi:unnamed protein product, partial [Symbiodinium necroappetens]
LCIGVQVPIHLGKKTKTMRRVQQSVPMETLVLTSPCCQAQFKGDVESVKGRTKVLERDLSSIRKEHEAGKIKVQELTEEVKNLKVQWGELQTKGSSSDRPDRKNDLANVPHDPWADYIRKQQEWPPPFGPARRRLKTPGGDFLPPGPARGHGPATSADAFNTDPNDTLTEDEKKTLIIGGWVADTRKAVIEEESEAILLHPTIKDLIDTPKLAVYGPRRSVGMLKFSQRADEHCFEDVKALMWLVVKAVAALKLNLDSTKQAGETKVAWAGFVKTRNARLRTSHISMIRRVTVGLVEDTKDDNGCI